MTNTEQRLKALESLKIQFARRDQAESEFEKAKSYLQDVEQTLNNTEDKLSDLPHYRQAIDDIYKIYQNKEKLNSDQLNYLTNLIKLKLTSIDFSNGITNYTVKGAEDLFTSIQNIGSPAHDINFSVDGLKNAGKLVLSTITSLPSNLLNTATSLFTTPATTEDTIYDTNTIEIVSDLSSNLRNVKDYIQARLDENVTSIKNDFEDDIVTVQQKISKEINLLDKFITFVLQQGGDVKTEGEQIIKPALLLLYSLRNLDSESNPEADIEKMVDKAVSEVVYNYHNLTQDTKALIGTNGIIKNLEYHNYINELKALEDILNFVREQQKNCYY